jgi:hypothetical protein
MLSDHSLAKVSSLAAVVGWQYSNLSPTVGVTFLESIAIGAYGELHA